ncbi:MAG: amidohydrolase family protein [Pseudomonadota bacterium]
MSGDFYIVDAHHHLWDLGHCHYPWLMEKGVKRFFGDPAPIQKNYLVKDFRADIGDLPVRKSVHIQVGVAPEDSVKETCWVQSQGDTHGLPNAIVAFCDLTAPGYEAQLDAHRECARLRGIRQIVGRSAEEDAKLGTNGLLHDPTFFAGLKRLAALGLSFDLQLTPPLLGDAAKLFAQLPDLKVAICHAGSPSDFSEDGQTAWKTGMAQMADLPNVICKLSGFGMFQPGWTIDTIRPLIMTCIDLFGPERIAFASNFPVDKLAADYGRVMRAYLEVCNAFSKAERAVMFAETAERFYDF